ncbi:MAG: hypothetical protein ACOYEV_16470 [Candidatus Nanopelagicales bacterium]
MSVVELCKVAKAHPPASTSRPARSRGITLFAGLAMLYFAVGYLLMMRYNLFDPDAPSRVANAGYVLESRDPHLSAVGFVWNPLPSLVEVPILQLSRWWPELRSHGLAGVVQSALFMAGAAVMVARIAMDRGVGTFWRRLSVAAFALQPMIVVYGGSGMSEAAETFCALWCVRRLMLWTDTRRPADLAGAGLALGVGYLARYEVVPAAVGAAVFVGAVTAGGVTYARSAKACANVAILMFPIVVVATVWAISGWVVNQELFATLSSRYGNESIVAAANRRSGPTAPAGSGDWVGIAARIFGMQPFAGFACGAAMVHGAVTRTLTALVPAVVFGPILAFAAWGQYSSTTFGCFRYYLLGIPLVICIALALCAPQTPGIRQTQGARRFGALLLCASVVIGYPVTVAASLNERIGNQPLQFGFNSLLFPDRFTPDEPQQVWYRRLMVDDRLLADHLDRMDLPDGAVLMDTFNTWGVWMSSTRPKQFIITSDFDFKAALNRPWEHGVQYLLVSSPITSDADALNVRYPTLWNDGAGMARLLYAINGAADEERFRLFRVTGPPRRVGQPSVGPS